MNLIEENQTKFQLDKCNEYENETRDSHYQEANKFNLSPNSFMKSSSLFFNQIKPVKETLKEDIYSMQQSNGIKRSQSISVTNQTKYDTLTQKRSFLSSMTNSINDENRNMNENVSMSSPINEINNYTLNRQSIRRGSSFRNNNNENLISEIFRNQTNKPVPPNRTSSLQYKSPQSFQQQQALKTYKNSFKSRNDDRNSIYSSYSLRLSTLNFDNLTSHNKQTDSEYMSCYTLLNQTETDKIESCYKSIGSNVYSSKSQAGLYFTNLQNLINLNDWKLEVTGVPVWVFNTGLNPKRPKGLTLVIADKKTGFALWKSNPITFINDFKWSRPGHVTFKVYDQNFDQNNNINNSNNSKSVKSIKSVKSRPKSMSFSTDTLRSTISRTNSIKSNMSLVNETSSSLFMFAAVRFEDEFECSKFYDFYRCLFVDSQHDDLFNPHYKHQNNNSLKKNFIKVLYKKITKNSISSPVAFNHINSLSVVFEEPYINNYTQDYLNSNSNSSSLSSSSSSADTQSMLSELTVTSSHNNSSIITNKRNKI